MLSNPMLPASRHASLRALHCTLQVEIRSSGCLGLLFKAFCIALFQEEDGDGAKEDVDERFEREHPDLGAGPAGDEADDRPSSRHYSGVWATQPSACAGRWCRIAAPADATSTTNGGALDFTFLAAWSTLRH